MQQKGNLANQKKTTLDGVADLETQETGAKMVNLYAHKRQPYG